MTVRIGPAGVWSSFDRLPAGEVLDFAGAAEAAGYDTFWTQETAGRDPFALLAGVAGVTRRIGLGVGISVIYGRDPVAMRAGASCVRLDRPESPRRSVIAQASPKTPKPQMRLW